LHEGPILFKEFESEVVRSGCFLVATIPNGIFNLFQGKGVFQKRFVYVRELFEIGIEEGRPFGGIFMEFGLKEAGCLLFNDFHLFNPGPINH